MTGGILVTIGEPGETVECRRTSKETSRTKHRRATPSAAGLFQIGTVANRLSSLTRGSGTSDNGLPEGSLNAAGRFVPFDERVGGFEIAGLNSGATLGVAGVGVSDCGKAGLTEIGAISGSGGGTTGCDNTGSWLAEAFVTIVC